MPNFNGAIALHTLQYLDGPATFDDILATIAGKTHLPEDQLRESVSQTLEVGARFGFLQKRGARYFLVPMTFEMLEYDLESFERNQQDVKRTKLTKPLNKTELKGVVPKAKKPKKPKKVDAANQPATKKVKRHISKKIMPDTIKNELSQLPSILVQ